MPNPLRAVSSALATPVLAAPVALGVTPAAAAPAQPVVYDALGDSYGSGYGVAPYEACGRSRSAYAVQLDGRMRIDLDDDVVACAGATTGSLVAGGQLDALDAETDLVTISIGGNDIGWSSAVGACLAGGDAQCAGALGLTRTAVTTVLPALLDAVHAQVAARAPGAHVVVTEYPRLFRPSTDPSYARPSRSRWRSTRAPTCSTRSSPRRRPGTASGSWT